jgi:hypothetical protein
MQLVAAKEGGTHEAGCGNPNPAANKTSQYAGLSSEFFFLFFAFYVLVSNIFIRLGVTLKIYSRANH